MPTRPRIDIAGYHHIINRGVDQMNVFRHNEDKDMFLKIVNKTAIIHKVVVHDYCLMDNHYHLLIETQTDNLSRFMRFVSANYAQYFNKKTKRTGHLWQNRYKSRYVSSERYVYTLIRYIEFNPIEARLSEKVGEYPFTLAHLIFNSKDFYPCTKESILFRDYDVESLSGFLGVEFSQDDLTFLQTEQNRKIEKKEDMIILSKSKSLEEHFMDVKSKTERNKIISLAYLEDGYSQIEIADYLGLSKSAVSLIIKKFESGDLRAGV
jgi:REP element-mobilizing transposase RayT